MTENISSLIFDFEIALEILGRNTMRLEKEIPNTKIHNSGKMGCNLKICERENIASVEK
jgi:hypothetical protein